jgi:hypothetical protein
MIVDEQKVAAQVTPLEVVWRNPTTLVQVHLRAEEAGNPYYKWGEQAIKIRARRANWNVHHRWAA